MRVLYSLVLTRECNVNRNCVSYLGGEFIFLDYFPTACVLCNAPAASSPVAKQLINRVVLLVAKGGKAEKNKEKFIWSVQEHQHSNCL
jgi:hypothetical protein